MGTKDNPQKSNLILGAALSVSILVGGATTGYSVHKISNLEDDIAKQQQVIETQGRTLEEQGISLTNQQNENKELKRQNNLLRQEIKDYNEVIKAKDKAIDKLTKEKKALASRGETANYQEFYVEASGYIALCSEGCTGITATGFNLQAHPSAKVIAVDPKVIPLGSKVYVEGYGYAVAADTGGAIDGYKVDLHFPTESAALEWGRKKVKIKVFN